MRSSTFSSDALLLGGLFLGVAVGGGALLTRVFHEPSWQTLAVETLDAEVKTLVLGSSRVMYGIDPSAYETKTISLAANFLDLRTAARLWATHAAKVPAVEAVVLELDVATIAYDVRQLNPYGTVDLGLGLVPPLEDFAADFDGAVHRMLSPFFTWRLTPRFLRLRELERGSGAEPKDAAPGYVPSRLTVTFPELYAERKIDEATAQIAAAPPAQRGRNRAALLALADDLARRGVRLTLLRFPHEPHLRPIYPRKWDELVQDELQALRAARPALGWTFVDLTRDERFVTEDFRDPDHLNARGAAKLATILAARLAPPPLGADGSD